MFSSIIPELFKNIQQTATQTTGALPTVASTTQSAPTTQTTGALQTAASTTDAANTASTGALTNAVNTVTSSTGTDTTQGALSNVATAYRNYESTPRTSSGVALSTIKDEFNAIYDDQTLTGPQKAIKVQQLANTNKYSNADIAQALGVTEDILGTFFGQEQPNWEREKVNASKGLFQKYRTIEYYINPVTGERVASNEYLRTANTPEAIAWRNELQKQNAPFLNFEKTSGLGADTAYKVWNGVSQYNNPVTGVDETQSLKYYLANQLKAQGITDFSQIESRVIKGTPEKTDLGGTEYLILAPWGDGEMRLARSGPDGPEHVNANEYELGETYTSYGGDGGGYTTVAARRKNVTPATPDVTKYYNKNTGQEITNQILFDDKVGTKYVLTDQGVQKDG